MSYILDALRRAESERERGSVPSLHSPAAPAPDAEAGRAAPGASWWPWLVAAVASLLLVAALIWQWPSRQPAAVLATPARKVAPPPAVTATPTPVPLGPELTRVAPPQPPQPALAAAPAATAAPRAAAAPKTASTATDRLPTASELPESLRRELPTVTTGGAMYSDTPANRMLILNGQIYHEGEKIAPHLVLEQIMLRGAVLSFKGQRYTISF